MLLSLIAALAATTASAVDTPIRYGTISCRTVKDVPFQDCPVALISRGEGRILAEITTPDGRLRRIFFRGGVPLSTNAGSRLHFERNRDTLVVHVGQAEVYEMPDRLIAGE